MKKSTFDNSGGVRKGSLSLPRSNNRGILGHKPENQSIHVKAEYYVTNQSEFLDIDRDLNREVKNDVVS